MATNPTEGYAADFFEQIMMSPYAGLTGTAAGSSSETPSLSPIVPQFYQPPAFPSSLSLDNARAAIGEAGAFLANPDGVAANSMNNLYLDQLQTHGVNHPLPQTFQDRPIVPNPPSMRPRARARRGQATDPHSIAERLRRERISERFKALQEIVPSCTKTDRAIMLDEILDYVKFLRLQVKILSMSRLGPGGAAAELIENRSCERDDNLHEWEKWASEETEGEVVKLMEEDTGAAMQFLQSKSLCIMPISLASLLYPRTHPPILRSSNPSLLPVVNLPEDSVHVPLENS